MMNDDERDEIIVVDDMIYCVCKIIMIDDWWLMIRLIIMINDKMIYCACEIIVISDMIYCMIDNGWQDYYDWWQDSLYM
jgi:hypothetical protein